MFSTGTYIETANGARVYTPLSLKIYNVGVFGIVSPYNWRCPAEILVTFFNCNIFQVTQPDPSSPSAPVPRVLDISVGTGYFSVRAPLTSETELILVDLNTDCLNNYEDSAASFAKPFPRAFHDVKIKVVGCMHLFEARNPKLCMVSIRKMNMELHTPILFLALNIRSAGIGYGAELTAYVLNIADFDCSARHHFTSKCCCLWDTLRKSRSTGA